MTDVETTLKRIITSLYDIMVQSHGHRGEETQRVMSAEFSRLLRELLNLMQAGVAVSVPVDLTEYVERSRNPDIYTRSFVEAAMRMNQELKGKSQAMEEFTVILAREIKSGIPALASEVGKLSKV